MSHIISGMLSKNTIVHDLILISSSAHDRKDSWDALKYKFAKKIADAHLGNGEAQNSDFIYVFGGSSVTAGHDIFYRESYPKVFERRLQPVFDALRVGLSVRNIAIGSVGCEPYNACYEALSGTADPDFVTWYACC